MKTALSFFAASVLATACAASSADTDSTTSAEGELRSKPACTGQEPPRQGAPFEINASGTAKFQAFQDAMEAFRAKQPELDEYARIINEYSLKLCTVDSECAPPKAGYSGSCNRYVWEGTNGLCAVTPDVPVPQAPAAPKLTCDDVVCPTIAGVTYQCEVESHNLAVGCVEPLTCIPMWGHRGARR